MNETRGNARTKPMKRGGIKGEEKNSLKDSEKTNELKIKGCLLHNSDLWKTPKKMYDYFIKNNFLEGRLHFNDSSSAPFPSMIVSFALKTPFLLSLQFAYLEKKTLNGINK